jgi:hypothetical protein
MKRKDLIRHLEAHGCELLREGGSHTICFAQKVRKIFVFDIELQRSSQIRAQGCFNPGECWFPGNTQLRRSWRTLTEFICGYSRYPRVGNPGLKLANAFGVRLFVQSPYHLYQPFEAGLFISSKTS